ncbi:efflux transporter outer membrane subunit [Dyella sp. SG609]|uniref:efflux transporter outer membrane subunit n=1 Tax=Dyella sp. SG609 TaxID=2587018 RepID=UPI00144515C0|nr:efflux transporter outer membrane subunit [Dyella sp. SG609]NKJ21722.1 NodT family efflux transporter outer membrane factor (OMF) lipoprotein [Dyella sp. SG609]
MRQLITRYAGCALALGLAGCAAGPDFHRPEAPKARIEAPSLPDGDTQKIVAAMDIPGQWWTLFHCAPLDALIADALRRNADAQAAHAALQAAWENVYAQRGAYFPQANAGYNPTRQDIARDLASPAQSGASLYSLTTAQVSVSYAPDLWGGTRRQVESLVATAHAQRFQLEATYLTLTSNLVNAAITEASLRAQIDATREIVEAQSTILATLQRQQALGDVSEAAVAAQQAALEQSRAGQPPLEKQLAQQRDLLAALSGRMPNEQIDAQFTLDSLQLPAELPLSLPAQLVEQRPDVRAAEEQLHAASAAIGVAAAARLPNVQINASFGRAAGKAGALFDAGSGFWNLGAGITQPLFDGGTLKHKQRAAEAGYRQAAAEYRGTVLAALQNVADVLHAVEADARALQAAQHAERAAARSLDIARKQLALGDLSESALLNAQLAWQQARIALVQAQAGRYADTVALFQAAGGGWWHRDDTVEAVGAR